MDALSQLNQTRDIQVFTFSSWPNYENATSNSTMETMQIFVTNVLHSSPVVSHNSSNAAEMMKSVVSVLNTYAVPVICVLGIFGDVTSFLVFVFSSFRYQPCSQYLAALTFVDTLFLFSQFFSSLMTFIPSLGLAPGCCSVIVYVSYVCSFLSAWFVVLMMMERYIVVCHPFRASAICSKRKSLALISALAVLSLILYSHSFFTTSKSVLKGPCVITSDYYEFLSIFTYVDSVLVFVIPFLALLWLNLRIIFTVRKFRLRHSIINQSIRRTQRYHNTDKTLSLAQVRSTKMLVWVSSVFIVLYLPSYAARLYGLILQEVTGTIDEGSSSRLQTAQHFCQFLYHLSFAIDFIVYIMTSYNFRRNVSRCLKNSHSCKQSYAYRY